jgi:hypothetical protein
LFIIRLQNSHFTLSHAGTQVLAIQVPSAVRDLLQVGPLMLMKFGQAWLFAFFADCRESACASFRQLRTENSNPQLTEGRE